MVRLVPVEGNPFKVETPEGVLPGVSSDTPAPTSEGASPLWDIIRSAGTGVRRGSEAMVGLGGEVNKGLDWASEKVGLPAGTLDIRGLANPMAAAMPDAAPQMPAAPDIEAVEGVTKEAIGDHYQPDTTAGKYARTVGEFVPGALATGGAASATGGLSAIGRMLMGNAVIPGLASEAAGQATEGTQLEPYARAAGGFVGGVGGHALTAPRRALTAAQREREELLHVARQHGVELPNFMMPDSPGGAIAARRMADLPFLGTPVRQASERTAQQMGERATSVARELGDPDWASVSGRTRDTLDNFVTSAAPAAQREAFDAVDKAIFNPHIKTPLTNTRKLLDDFDAEMRADTTRGARPVMNRLREAAGRTAGMPYDAIKRLRTEVGAMMDDDKMPSAAKRPLKAAYAALTQDLEHAVGNSGGQAGINAWEKANTVTRTSKAASREVQNVIGKSGSMPADTVLKSVRSLASARDAGAWNRLAVIRAAMDEADIRSNATRSSWDDVGAALLDDMGRDPKNPGQWSPKNYLDAWSKMSDDGKDILFTRPAHRDALDDLAYLARSFKDVRTPSPYGMVATGGAVGMGIVASWPAVLGGLVGGRTLSSMLASPASAQKVLSFARALQGAGRAGPGSLQTSARALAKDMAEREDRDPEELYERLMEAVEDGRD